MGNNMQSETADFAPGDAIKTETVLMVVVVYLRKNSYAYLEYSDGVGRHSRVQRRPARAVLCVRVTTRLQQPFCIIRPRVPGSQV